MTTAPNPGINSKAALWHLDQDERRIIDHFSKEWLVTSVGPINLGSSSNYKFALLKPTIQYQDMFNLEREIIAIFSPYNEFQPRSLDAIDEVYERHQKLRVERVCTILFSRDNEIESKLQNILKNDKEAQIVVPFSYQDFNEPLGNYFIRSRFRKHFYTRDLFAFESPLRSDRYFFGRTDLIHVITNRHRSNENSGLFGLRKTGKTSVIFGITRALSLTEDRFVVIDCQNTAFHRRRWNKALYYIISETKHQNNINTSTHSEQEYTEEDAAILFEKDIINIYKIFEEKSIMIVFDEIENITFNVSPSEHWANGLDFVFFWQTLRSLFQKQNRVFSYLIVGTNPMCVEAPIIQGKDNPIFNQIPFQYMPRFDVPQTREMVRKLGRIMGLKFEEIIYGRLTEDFGGHPYLIRHVCSIINDITPDERPTVIDKSIYERAKVIFRTDYSNYVEMILNVLREFYSDEYAMLEYLAAGDLETFKEFASISHYYVNHLIGYGIIDYRNDNFTFRIETIQEYLARKQKYKRINISKADMWREISERRNNLEVKLRLIVRNQLRASFGKAQATNFVLSVLGDPRKSEQSAFSYEKLFDPNSCKIYFEDIRKTIIKHWDCFKNVFNNKDDFDLKMQTINRFRADAHAKDMSLEEFTHFRVSISSIETQVADFLD